MRIGDDPSLDFFMVSRTMSRTLETWTMIEQDFNLFCNCWLQRSYVDLLAKLGEDIEEPFNKFMQFKDATTKTLENICGHYIESESRTMNCFGYHHGDRIHIILAVVVVHRAMINISNGGHRIQCPVKACDVSW